jgi:Alginate export
MRSLFPILVGALLAASALAGERPAPQDLRFDEDWSVLAQPDALASRDPFDPVKWIALGDGTALSFGGQARARFEAWDGFAFGAPTDDDDALFLTRFRLHADLLAGKRFRVFVEAKAAFTTEPGAFDGARATDSDTIDLQNGFLEWEQPLAGDALLRVRAGRQELRLGKQRLVSPLDWANARRTFDGATLEWMAGKNEVALFAVAPVRVRPYERNDHVTNLGFWGVHARRELGAAARVDAYYYGLAREGALGEERRHTLGARASSPIADTRFDVEGEAAYQFGRRGSADISAGMVAAQLGYWVREWRVSPRFFVGLDWASGDEHAGGDLALFDQLFPLGHAYLGIADVVARQNIVAASAGVTLRPLPALTAELAVHHFERAGRSDGLFNAGGAQLRAGDPNASREVGDEIDLSFAYRFDAHLQLGGGWAHFFPGHFLEQTGPSRDLDFAYLLAQFTF